VGSVGSSDVGDGRKGSKTTGNNDRARKIQGLCTNILDAIYPHHPPLFHISNGMIQTGESYDCISIANTIRLS